MRHLQNSKFLLVLQHAVLVITSGWVDFSKPDSILTYSDVSVRAVNLRSKRYLTKFIAVYNFISLHQMLLWALILSPFEPRHDKTNKMSVRPAKTQIRLGIPRLIWVFTCHTLILLVLSCHGLFLNLEHIVIAYSNMDIWKKRFAVRQSNNKGELITMVRLIGWKKCTINIWATSWQNQQSECAPSEDSDQPGHPPSLISLCCPHEESSGP